MSKYIELSKVQKTIMRMTNDVHGADIAQEVGKIPAADVQKVKHGDWITKRMNLTAVWCSQCCKASEEITPYCPFCGAKMGRDRILFARECKAMMEDER